MSDPKVTLLNSLLLTDFPSGSSVNYYHDKFYLIGDDATHILILDKNFDKCSSVHLFDHAEPRISKRDKTDLEGSAVVEIAGVDHLILLGSASRKNRKRIIAIPFSNAELNLKRLKSVIHKTKDFIKRIKNEGIQEINLEGITSLREHLILGNRAGRANERNHLIVTQKNFWEDQLVATLKTIKLILPLSDQDKGLGLSELCYVDQWDVLLVTFTTEATANSYDDGEIGDSYIGWISNASEMIQRNELTLDGCINLHANNSIFKKEKIEGICVESIAGSQAVMTLVSDNDLGESRLFRIAVSRH